MKKRNLLLVMLAVMLVFGMVIGCGPVEEEETIPVTFSGLAANGSSSATTTTLTLTFSEVITGLGTSDITVGPGATKGALSSVGGGVYNLSITGVTGDVSLSVSVSKKGYTITPSSKTVDIKISDADKAALAAAAAAKYFGEYKTSYQTTSPGDTTEYITIEKTSGKYVLTIEEKKDGNQVDKLIFAINDDGWEIVSVPASEANADESARGTFDVGFKVKGKITDSTSGYLNSNKTNPDSTKLKVGDDAYITLYLASCIDDDELWGYLLLRTGFSKNGDKLTVITGNPDTNNISKKRVYLLDL